MQSITLLLAFVVLNGEKHVIIINVCLTFFSLANFTTPYFVESFNIP